MEPNHLMNEWSNETPGNSNTHKSNSRKAGQELSIFICKSVFNPLTLNGHCIGRNAPLTSRRFILNIYSTNIRTEYFKHAA
jgi:hypothetical protein